SPDSRSKSLGDIEIKSTDEFPFEAIEIKHLKPISLDIISDVYQKIKNTSIDRYYILTTNEPNFDDKKSIEQKIIEYSKLHSCQIIVNGVLPSLKYYLRLVSNPELFINKYTYWLEYEYNRASGIKKEHLQVWQEICKNLFNINNN
ncbi:MAG: DNA cytosine methyltransferase, partial [Blastocatellia bacterium]|nr:DNA cytosine methyltransferase [Blastocatellia bacterium]